TGTGPFTINEPGAFSSLTVTGTSEWRSKTNRLKATSTFIVGSNATYNSNVNDLKTLASSTVRIKGTYQADNSSNQIFQGDFDNDGTFTPNGGTALFNGGTTQDVDIGSDNFSNFTVDGNGTTVNVTTNTLDVNGSLNLTGGTLGANGNNVTVAGDWKGEANTDNFTEGSDKVTFDATGTNQKITDGETFNELVINNGNGQVSSTVAITAASTTVKQNTFRPYDETDFNGDVTINSGATLEALNTTTLTVAGNFNNKGTFTPNSGTTTFDGGSNQDLTSGGSAFNHLSLSNSGTLVPQDSLNIDGNTKIKSGTTLDLTQDKSVNTAGDVTINGSVSKGTGTWTFDGSGTNNLDANGGNTNLGEIKINGSSKVVKLTNTKAHVTTATIKSDDELDLNGQGLKVDNDIVNDNIFRLQGDESVTISGNYDNDSGTTTFDGAVSATTPSDITNVNNINFNNGSGTWTLPGKLDVEGNLSIDAGTLDVDSSNNYKINIAGDWDSSGGTFKYRNGTVEFDATGSATQTIKGSEFNNLTKTVSSTQTFELTTSATTTVHNTTTLKGESGNQLKLRSDTPGSQANFAVDKLKQDLDYVDIKDVNASVSNTLYCVNGCSDSGNNSSTIFSLNLSFAKSSDSGTEADKKNFAVELSEPYFVEDVTVDYTDSPGSASSNDYSMSNPTLTIPEGNKSTTTAEFNPTNDAEKEGDETVNLAISSIGPNYSDFNTTTPDALTYTISKNDQYQGGGSSSGGGGGGGGGAGSSSSDVTKTQEGEKEGAIVINGGNKVTTKREVTIEFNVRGAEKVAPSEDSQFKGVSFDSFPSNNQMGYTLSEGVEEKTVYAKFRDSQGSTITESDSITYNPQGEVIDKEPKEEPKETEEKKEKPLPQELKSDRAYTYPGTSAVYYITQQGTKRPFKNPDVFFTYFDSWSDVQTVSQNALMSVPDDELGFMPWGPKKDFRSGSMIKTVTDPKVYLIIDNKRYWIENGQIFKELGYKWNMITDVDPRVMDKFELGESIDYTNHHPPYSLVKYPDSNKVYRLEPNEKGELVKRHIKDQESFNALGYRLDRIITIDESEQYPTGEPISVESGEKVPYTFSRYLKRGSQGTEVRNLQKVLKNLGYFESEVTGYYGLNTVNAVMDFQEANGMERVGVLGPKTRETLNNM
ncbi:MAG: peptidoglycan-binding protein, partial [Candidatus Magasanikbacteria bacterium]